MKYALQAARFFVAVLFILSGLVKANDPLGLAYKMMEFFDVWKDSLEHHPFFLSHGLISLFTFLNAHALALSIFMIAFEIIAGVALLLGWQMRLVSWLLLLLIIFFTFLTAYAYYSGKFKNCGCFGDCLPITPLTSFLKDILLTILILFLFFNKHKIRPILTPSTSRVTFFSAILASFGIQWYTLNYLPVADCLPFRVGNNIPEKMKMPADAVPDSTVITFVYNKGGKEVEFTATEFPADFNSTTYQFVKRYDRVVRKGKNNEPPIKGYALSGSTGEDSTAIVMSQPFAMLLFCENFDVSVSDWSSEFATIYAEARSRNVPVYMVVTQEETARQKIRATPFADMPVFKCDYTAIRSAARVSPTLYLLKQGTIQGKWSYRRMRDGLNKLETLMATSKQ